MNRNQQLYIIAFSNKSSEKQLNNYRVKAKAQLGENWLKPRRLLVEEELHLATIPLVGRLENNSFLIH